MGVIMGIISSLPGALSQGVLWGIMALGVYITYKILDIADLTVDGSFALGGSVCAICIVGGMHPMLAILVAIVAGCVAGAVTGILHAVFDIPAILAGILTQLGLYSINLRIMGRSNTPLLKEETIVDKLAGLLPNMKNSYTTLIIGVLAVVIVILVSYWFFGTEVGSEIRATGNNEAMVKALGGNTRLMKALGLAISNGLVALSGALVCQSQGYADEFRPGSHCNRACGDCHWKRAFGLGKIVWHEDDFGYYWFRHLPYCGCDRNAGRMGGYLRHKAIFGDIGGDCPCGSGAYRASQEQAAGGRIGGRNHVRTKKCEKDL